MSNLDLSMPVPVAAAFVSALLFPLWLVLTARITRLAERHAARFAASAILMGATWAGAHLALPTGSAAGALAGLCVVLGALLFYLEVWALMTRGYTLGILITLLKAGRPLTSRQIFDGYRDGEGLGWIMRHRLGGLCATGFIARDGDRLTLGAGRGALVARLQGLCVAVLGLRRTG